MTRSMLPLQFIVFSKCVSRAAEPIRPGHALKIDTASAVTHMVYIYRFHPPKRHNPFMKHLIKCS